MSEEDTLSQWIPLPNSLMISEDVASIGKLLIDLQQQHLFADWNPDIDADVDKKLAFLSHAKRLHQHYPGGLPGYINKAKVLLQDALQGTNPLAGWIPSVPQGVVLEPFTEEYLECESIGKKTLASCGFVLVAGGLGERLGYSGIKIALPAETTTMRCYLSLYCAQILAIQRRYAAPETILPLAIMVSDDTASKTLELLETNDYFGMERHQVTIMKQEKVPALQSVNAEIAKLSTYEFDTKPHGHGDVHSLMHSTGTADRWLAQGVKWVVFFQDTNSTGFITLAAFLGVSVSLNLEVNSMTVPRIAKQAIGAITKLTHEDGRTMTINVEYNQLEPMLKATINPEGDVNDPTTGLSPFPGNINQLMFRMDSYCTTLHRTSGVVGEFVNPKYSDASRTRFKKPTRLECMMQDYPKALDASAQVGFTMAPSWLVYNPCKNNSADGAAGVKAGIPAHSAFTAESDYYRAYSRLLAMIGVNINSAPDVSFLGIAACPGPRIVFDPSFAIFPSEIRDRFLSPSKVSVSSNSTLVCSGDVVISNLSLDGALRVSAAPNSRIVLGQSTLEGEMQQGLAVKNEGHELRCSSSASEVIAMRGYEIEVHDESVVSSSTSDFFVEYLYDGNGLNINA